MGPELFPKPQADGKITSNLMRMSGAGKFGIQESSDSNLSHVNKGGSETFFGHFPSGTSFQGVNHFRQMMVARQFQKYDHGMEKNLELYGAATPPAYNLSNIKRFPIALFCGKEDLLSSPGDYKCLAAELTANDSCVFYKEFDMGHIAFLIPVTKYHILEMLHLAKTFNPDYKVQAV